MSVLRGLMGHGAALVIASTLALWVWTKDDQPVQDERLQAEVWSGSPDAVQLVRFESDSTKVQLAPQKDAQGRWFIGKVEKTTSAPVSPHGADAGAPPADTGQPKTTTFVAVEAAEKLIEKLAPLQAYRSVGKVDEARAAEFGLDKPQGTLSVRLGGKEHALVIGGMTPGGSDRYARDKATGEVWAIPGEVVDTLLFADARLLERDLHAFEPDEVKRVRVRKGAQQRELVRVPDKRDAWADPAKPEQADETAGNWMAKVDRVRVMEYVEPGKKPSEPEALVARVEYLGSGDRVLGFLELVRQGEGAQAEYLAKSELSRWSTKIAKSSGEQIEQDLGSILK